MGNRTSNADRLRSLHQDPRYWRDRDPAIVAEVQALKPAVTVPSEPTPIIDHAYLEACDNPPVRGYVEQRPDGTWMLRDATDKHYWNFLNPSDELAYCLKMAQFQEKGDPDNEQAAYHRRRAAELQRLYPDATNQTAVAAE